MLLPLACQKASETTLFSVISQNIREVTCCRLEFGWSCSPYHSGRCFSRRSWFGWHVGFGFLKHGQYLVFGSWLENRGEGKKEVINLERLVILITNTCHKQGKQQWLETLFSMFQDTYLKTSEFSDISVLR